MKNQANTIQPLSPFNLDMYMEQGNKSIPDKESTPPDEKTHSRIIACISALKNLQIDITQDYSNWLTVGFSFASLGENGRKYYHEVSQVNPGYTVEETEKKFTRLLLDYKGEIQIASFFHLCKQVLPSGIPGNTGGLQGTTEGNPQNIESILVTSQYLKANIKHPVTFASPIISQHEAGIIFPNTINVIQGKSGVHKSRLVEMLCSCLLSRDKTKDYLGYKVCPLQRYSVLYVDTERNIKDQYMYALQQIKKRAGFSIEDEMPSFDFISLIQISREQRFEALREYLELQKFTSHIFIVLDVITDCIMNFNDPKETMKLVDLLNVMINKYDVTFLCVIHENPSSGDKARGHLGTEIMNKASTVVQIGFEKDRNQNDTDLIKVKYLKLRIGKRPEPFYLVYSDSERGLVVADREYISDIMQSRKEKASIEDIKDFLTEHLIEPMERKKLLELIKQRFDCSANTALERLKNLIENAELIYNMEGIECILKNDYPGRGKVSTCFLEPLNASGAEQLILEITEPV